MDETMDNPKVPRNPMTGSRRDDVMSAIYTYRTVNLSDTLARLARARQDYSNLTIGELIKWAEAVSLGGTTVEDYCFGVSETMKIIKVDRPPFFIRVVHLIGRHAVRICIGGWVESYEPSAAPCRYIMFEHEFDLELERNNYLPFILCDCGSIELCTWHKICSMLTELVRDGGTTDENLE